VGQRRGWRRGAAAAACGALCSLTQEHAGTRGGSLHGDVVESCVYSSRCALS
jgi:hypothetical protein